MNAGKAVSAVMNGTAMKAYCSRVKLGKTEFALACETIKYKDIIDDLFERSNINAEILDVNQGLLYVYCYERLFGSVKIQGGGAVKRKLLEHEAELRRHLAELMAEKGAEEAHMLLNRRFKEFTDMPMYVRPNPLKQNQWSSAKDKVFSLYPNSRLDEHIPNLIVVPPPARGLGELPEVKEGALIIQDKASCMPSQLLFDEWKGGDIIDACAAPGNKTSHLAALVSSVQNDLKQIKITAFDKSRDRWELLTARMKQASADKIVTTCNEDFLAVDLSQERFSGVGAILVDPSCSGSGVVRSLDRVYERVQTDRSSVGGNEEMDRILRLKAFQISVVLKAMSFPSVKVVVYSTCSINEVYIVPVGIYISANNVLSICWSGRKRRCSQRGAAGKSRSCRSPRLAIS